MTIARSLVSAVALAALTACSAGGGGGPSRATRAASAALLRSIGTIGDPGKVAATDIAFARAARDEGQWTAFAEYAAPGALLHGPDGVVEAAGWLAGRDDPEQAVRWTPRAVFTSCDGTLAVSEGLFLEPDGTVGSYVTVWQPDNQGDYKWVYDMGAPDDPQPVPEQPGPDIPAGQDVIMVEALNAIEGKIADCADDVPPVAAVPPTGAADRGGGESRDRTLRWRWVHNADGSRRVSVTYLRDGEWQMPVDFAVGPGRD